MSKYLYMCTRDGLIYMLAGGRLIERPKYLYGEKIEREMKAMHQIFGYVQIDPAEFDQLVALQEKPTEELERRVRELGFDIERTPWGHKIMDDFNALEAPDEAYADILRDIIRHYPEDPKCECDETLAWINNFFDSPASHIEDCPDCGKHTLHVCDESARCVNPDCQHSSGVDAEGNVYRNGQIISHGGKSIEQLRDEYFFPEDTSFLAE